MERMQQQVDLISQRDAAGCFIWLCQRVKQRKRLSTESFVCSLFSVLCQAGQMKKIMIEYVRIRCCYGHYDKIMKEG